MADFYDIQVHWKTGRITSGRGVGNNAAWICECKELSAGTARGYVCDSSYAGKPFQLRGRKPKYVAR